VGRLIRPHLVGHLAMLLFSAIVAGSFSLGGSVANDISPVALNTVRFWVAVAILGAVMKLTGKGSRQTFKAPWRYAILGGMYACYFVLMFMALKSTSPVNLSVVFTLTPVMAGGFGYFLLRQVMSPRIALALAIGGAGAVWVIFRGDVNALLAFEVGSGEALYFWGCAAHALYTPLARRLNRGAHVIPYTFGTLLAAAIWITGYGWRDLLLTDWANLPNLVWVTILYIAVFATSVTSLLLLFATQRLPSSKVMAYTYLVPTWVIAWEYIRHAYVPAGIVLVGVAMTLIALLLLLRE